MNENEELTRFFQTKSREFPPFDQELLLFCEGLSQALFQQSDHKENPDFIALAFWLRKTHLYQIQQFFQQKAGKHVPRGLVFHIPPGNIDVMLVYSWITSLLLGNRNIIRISGNRTIKGDQLLNIVFSLLSEDRFSIIKQMNFFIEYSHEEEITALISSKVDARIIWGGDETIVKIRRIPLQPHAVDIAFPDRFSYSVIRAETYLTSNHEDISIRFFNDAFWFDQSACSSPRILFWLGAADVIEKASQLFYQTLQGTIQKRQYHISLGGALLKKAYLFSQSLLLPVEKVVQYSNELSLLFLHQAEERCRFHCGQGLFYHVAIDSLDAIVAFATHKDQTLTYHGFSDEELDLLASNLNGRGISRIVPFGHALNFEPVWDGLDLFNELTQHAVIEGTSK